MKKAKSKSSNKISSSLLALVILVALFLSYKYLRSKQIAQPVDINAIGPGSSSLSLTVQPATPTLDLNIKTPVKIVLDAGGSIYNVGGYNDSKPQSPIPSGCSLQKVQCVTAPCDPVLICEVQVQLSSPQPTSIPTTINKLIAATVEFTYDPTQLTITDVVKGDYFSNTLAAPVVDPAGKKVTFSFGVSPSDGGRTGSGVLATFNVQPKVAGKSIISFGSIKEDSRNNCPEGKMCPQMYFMPIIETNTDIRAENFEGNLYKNLFSYSEVSRKGKLPGSQLSYIFLTPEKITEKIPSDIVDDSNVVGDLVNAQDYAQFVLDFNKTGAAGWIRSDINKDGKVNIADFAVLVREWRL